LPYVGRRGLEQQRAWKERELADLEREERELRPGVLAAQEVLDAQREIFQWPATLAEEVAKLQALPEMEAELQEGIKGLNQIDRAKFDDLAEQQAAKEQQLKALEEEQRTLLKS